jgi:Secretion system C-terminal sorting domain
MQKTMTNSLLLKTQCALAGFVLLFFFSNNSRAQSLSNGDFEVWDLYNTWTLEPLDWETLNDQLNTPVTQDSNAYEGDFAMRVKVLPGFEGGVQREASQSILTEIGPSELSFAVKCNVPDGDDLDNVMVEVGFLFQGEVVSTQSWTSFESIENWQLTTMQLPALDAAFDEIKVRVVAGYIGPLSSGSWDTWISVDQIAFSGANGVIENTDSNLISVFPNPCTEQFQLVLSNGNSTNYDVYVTDAHGKRTFLSKNKTLIDTSDWSSGQYFIEVCEKGKCIGKCALIVN